MEIKDIIERLKLKYKGDIEALEEIQRGEETIAYYKRLDKPEKALAHARSLEAFLEYWY